MEIILDLLQLTSVTVMMVMILDLLLTSVGVMEMILDLLLTSVRVTEVILLLTPVEVMKRTLRVLFLVVQLSQ